MPRLLNVSEGLIVSLIVVKTEYRIYSAENLVVMQLEGIQNLESLMDIYGLMLKDGSFREGMNGLVDMRRVSSRLSKDESKRLIEFTIEKSGSLGLWVALVDEPMETALALIYRSGVSKHHPVEICSSIQGASKLLKMDVRRFLKE